MDKLYTIIEVATKLNLSDKTLRRWEEAGKFTPSRTLGNQRRYSIEDLQILDAIKHGTINEQKDLLTVEQASRLCGVTPTTILRWEDAGKIHPLITSGNTYYPRVKLMEKMAELKVSSPEPIVPRYSPPIQEEPRATDQEELRATEPQESRLDIEQTTEPERATLTKSYPVSTNSLADLDGTVSWSGHLINALITLILILTYHLVFNATSPKPVSPQSGSVQGVSTTMNDSRVDDLITKLQDHISAEMLKDAKPIPLTTIKLDNTSLFYGNGILPKGKDQVLVTDSKITPSTPITLNFTNDYAPAKKYWVTTEQGSFTLHTDFTVATDSSFNYSFISLTSTASAAPSGTR